ncbi:MAG: UDP-N-acetylmuramoyl-L-alanyl-D-glutamate--2,6-diaminopimelate ligase [Candidatus Eisenbacteria bacterium]|nr:UDP-N-acetylmuramoyl-L-alanyl-D-glutamate--2,6-diaminopimelate ligase [Candidatus Eisenbacteria bacterium]
MTEAGKRSQNSRNGRSVPRCARPLPLLIADAGVETRGAPPGVEVSSVEYDSRRIRPGALFVAVRGFTVDGHDFVRDAAARGAVAALVERPTGVEGLREVEVSDTRRAMGPIAHEFYGRPSEKLATHGVTGTNGKTTTTYFIDSIMREAGMTTGVVGTLGYRIGDRIEKGERTSPESLDLARLLATMADEGVESVAMEVSSHALALSRATGVRFDTATFTNLSRDHLDFHGTFAEYKRVKKSLFESVEKEAGKPGCSAVVNAADDFGRELIAHLRSSAAIEVLTYGAADGDVRAEDVESTSSGTRAVFKTPVGSVPVRLRLVSAFNVMNALAAMTVAVSRSLPLETAAEGLAGLATVPGRLELVDSGQPFAVVVDYAHTPDALEKVLLAIRGLRPERVITVFGCGGDRDRGKRPIMGEIAVTNSDVVIVTSDNPRTEEPLSIIEEIVEGPGRDTEKALVEVIEDRREAIGRAISVAAPGDVVLIAGKGHENYQIVGTETRHFDDREEAIEAIRTLS